MSSNFNYEARDPVKNLTVRPARGILKFSKSMDESRLDHNLDMVSRRNNYQALGLTRSDSKSQKIPHFDEMNIIATYHPVNKDYGHMKIEEPKTPYSLNNTNIDEEMDTGVNEDTTACIGFDPDTLVQKLNESSDSCQSPIHRGARRSFDETTTLSPEALEHHKQFEKHRKQHYNEFEIVRLRKQEIEAELQALEQEEEQEAAAVTTTITTSSGSEEKESRSLPMSSSNNSMEPILIDHHPLPKGSISFFSHFEHIGDNDNQHDIDKRLLTSEEQGTTKSTL